MEPLASENIWVANSQLRLSPIEGFSILTVEIHYIVPWHQLGGNWVRIPNSLCLWKGEESRLRDDTYDDSPAIWTQIWISFVNLGSDLLFHSFLPWDIGAWLRQSTVFWESHHSQVDTVQPSLYLFHNLRLTIIPTGSAQADSVRLKLPFVTLPVRPRPRSPLVT